MAGRYLRVMLPLLLLVTVVGPVFQPAMAQPEPYLIGPGDVLALSFLEHPDWDRQLTVRTDGSTTMPRVGVVQVGGLSAIEAEALVARKFQLFDPTIGEVSLTVAQFNSLRIYVLGAVMNPGAHSFDAAPTVWEAIRAAGGPEDDANLSVVRVVPREGGFAATRVYDLSVVRGGLGEAPDEPLQAGDTVVVPGAETATAIDPALGVQVFGHVNTPGIIPLSEPRRMLTVLMLAGSPAVTGRLDRVDWVHQQPDGSLRASRINMDLFLREGGLAGNPLVYPGDSIRVHGTEPGWFSRTLPILLAIVGTTTAVIIAMDRTGG